MIAALEADAVREFAYRASQIAAICELAASALMADPDTYLSGNAFQGVGKMAQHLSNDLLNLTED